MSKDETKGPPDIGPTRPATVEDLQLGARLHWRTDTPAPRLRIPERVTWSTDRYGHVAVHFDRAGVSQWDLTWFVVETHTTVGRARVPKVARRQR